ncbi:MAG TPA: acetoacetate--CoA ligase [Nocardioidaceae bacterium]|nr:acetoacetate--CoA ligase [Nocardioidaceae bacterium]
MPADLTRSQTTGSPLAELREGDLLWTPSPERVASTNLAAFTDWVQRRYEREFPTYQHLWAWSVEETEPFWEAIWAYFGVRASQPYLQVLDGTRMPDVKWFRGARLNFAEHILRNEDPGRPALFYAGERAPLTTMGWDEFAGAVRAAATGLRELGVRPGDRVVGYLPNVPEAVVSMVATAAIGAVWAACSPDFGVGGALDRFGQLEPTVLIYADSYEYGGKTFDRSSQGREIAAQLTTLRAVVCVRAAGAAGSPAMEGAMEWSEFLDHPRVSPEEFEFEQVPFDQPLWVLFSSGTTGIPKAIVHGHGGIVLEQLKLQHLHMDLSPGDTAFFHTTTGWMMWNFLVSGMLQGVRPVLYDGNPAHPEVDVLWRIAQDSRVRFFGASPTYVELMERAGVVPRERFDLSALDAVMPAGSPVGPWCTKWFYDNVKTDLWVATGSGGTDCCTGFVGGVPTLPVYAGEIQAPSLGVAARAFNEDGESVVDEVGELVITKPMPSMPVTFWGDDDGTRYRAAYFEDYPGVWRHGDFFRVNQRNGCFVLGRSDATLNRQGVRIGTAEIYRAVEAMEEVAGAIVVNLDLPNGRFFMPLFVQLHEGQVLNEELKTRIRDRLRAEYTPRHVPDRIVQVPSIPMTRTGKKMEVPVRRLLLGSELKDVAYPDAMEDSTALDALVAYRDSQNDYTVA